jgi:hypothetical protein
MLPSNQDNAQYYIAYAVQKAALTPSYVKRKHFTTSFINLLSHYDHVLNVISFLFTFSDISYNSLIQAQQMAGVAYILTFSYTQQI